MRSDSHGGVPRELRAVPYEVTWGTRDTGMCQSRAANFPAQGLAQDFLAAPFCPGPGTANHMDIYRPGDTEKQHRLKIKIAGDETWPRAAPRQAPQGFCHLGNLLSPVRA